MYYKDTFFKTLFFFLMTATSLGAQSESMSPEGAMPATIFQHLVAREVSQLTIKTDFTKLFTERKKAHSLDAQLVLENGKDYRDTMDLKIELRGRNRRRVCNIPPIRLDFSKGRLAKRGLHELGDKLKLVTHCSDEYGTDYLLREYWAYRIYNELTPLSFQVYLIQVRYIDTGVPDGDVRESLAFLIESEDELADRIDSKSEDLWGMKPAEMDPQSYHYSLLFQYMIGNDDWGLTSPRNISFFKPTNGSLPIAIPYDFDFAGLVNAPYAIVNPNYNGKNVLDRVVIEKGASKKDLETAAGDFFKNKDQMLHCYEGCKWMTEDSKNEVQDYLVDFFDELKKSKKIARLFLSKK